MPLSPVQLAALKEATMQEQVEVMDAILGTLLEKPENNERLKQQKCFVLACKLGYTAGVKAYLSSNKRQYDTNTLYAGLVNATMENEVDVAKVLVTTRGLETNHQFSNYDDPLEDKTGKTRDDYDPCSILTFAATDDRLNVLSFFLSLEKTSVNYKFGTAYESNLTALYFSVLACQPKATKLLLEHGGDPTILQTTIGVPNNNLLNNPDARKQIGTARNAFLLAKSQANDPQYVDVLKVLEEWKQKQDILNGIKNAKRKEPQSGYNSGNSSGSDSPPRSGERSHSSTSSSPESVGSIPRTPPREDSPPKPPKQSQTPSLPVVQRNANGAKKLSEKAALALEIRGGDPDKALSHASSTSSYSLDVCKELADLGLTFKEVCEDKNIFQKLLGVIPKYDIAEYLISVYPYCVNLHNSKGQTALNLVVTSGCNEHHIVEEVAFLLRHGADPTIADKNGHTPFYHANQKNLKTTATALKAKEEEIQSKAAANLRPAAAPKQVSDINNNTAPVDPVNGRQSPMANLVNPKIPAYLSPEAAKVLKLRGTPDKALFYASAVYPFYVSKELADLGLIFEEQNFKTNVFQLQFIGVFNEEKRAVAEYLVSKYPHCINLQNSEGKTALNMAVCITNDEEMTSFLLHHGADPTIADKDGHTPLHYAQQSNSIIIAAALKAKEEEIQSKAANNSRPAAASRQVTNTPKKAASSLALSAGQTLFAPAAQPAQSRPVVTPQPATAARPNNTSHMFLEPVKTDSSKEYERRKKSGLLDKIKQALPGSGSDKDKQRSIKAQV